MLAQVREPSLSVLQTGLSALATFAGKQRKLRTILGAHFPEKP